VGELFPLSSANIAGSWEIFGGCSEAAAVKTFARHWQSCPEECFYVKPPNTGRGPSEGLSPNGGIRFLSAIFFILQGLPAWIMENSPESKWRLGGLKDQAVKLPAQKKIWRNGFPDKKWGWGISYHTLDTKKNQH